MNQKLKTQADFLYLTLAALFIASLVTTNLIANKFVTVDLGFKEFVISAGMIPYPFTFLITDILSEIYGKRKTTNVVITGFFATLFVLLILWLGSIFPAIEQSHVTNEVYDTVFANSYRVVFSSMLAYLVAQFADLRLFHFWKNLTNGKHLWLRNNASTIVSQLLDTILVVGVLFIGKMTVPEMAVLVKDGWMYKILFALVDTPVMYLAVFVIRKKFQLQPNEEMS
ncbi:queuosine precursor transporter [bacterium SCSIO 12643]|nr:queuosine precursor transporter [bacterium SCSIO 12643]